MAEFTVEQSVVASSPDLSQVVTEDDTPVDNLFSAKQQRLLVEPLYTSWQPERPFIADANVGIFSAVSRPAIVPEVFVSLDVEIAEDWFAKEHRSYFVWEFGKVPEVVIEIVSNTKGEKAGQKLQKYAQLGVLYYLIYDPQRLIQEEFVRLYELHVGEYVHKKDLFLDKIGLGLMLWQGIFEAKEAQWLRWCDADGKPLPTGAERAEQARQRAERLEAQLKALGIEPEA